MARLSLKRLALSLAVGLAFAAQPVCARETQPLASALHATGDYAQAIETGRSEDTVEGLVAAAKSGLFLAAYAERDKVKARELLAQATQDAQKAVDRAPENIDANLQLAIAQGYFARIKMSPGRAKKARKRAEWLAQNAPDDGYALGLLGGWHGEAIAAYGKLIADVTVGADVALFETYFDKATAAAPNNALIIAYYVRLLLDIKDDGMREKAVALLANIEDAKPADAFEGFMKARALELKDALEAGDKKRLKRLVKKQRPFHDQK